MFFLLGMVVMLAKKNSACPAAAMWKVAESLIGV